MNTLVFIFTSLWIFPVIGCIFPLLRFNQNKGPQYFSHLHTQKMLGSLNARLSYFRCLSTPLFSSSPTGGRNTTGSLVICQHVTKSTQGQFHSQEKHTKPSSIDCVSGWWAAAAAAAVAGRVEAADIPDKPVILRFMWYTGTCFPLSESHRQTQYWGFCFLRGSEILLHVILFSSLSLITVCRVEGHRKRWLYGRLHWHEGVSQVTFLKPNKNISAHKATTRVHVVFNFWLVGWLYMCYGFHCHLFP